jgi:hypothetical protein
MNNSKCLVPLPDQLTSAHLSSAGYDPNSPNAIVLFRNLVLHAAARVISAVARIDIPEGKWQDLLQFLYQCCNSPNAAHREVGIYCLYTLFETVSEVFLEHLGNLFELFAKSLNDPESKTVRVTTLQ